MSSVRVVPVAGAAEPRSQLVAVAAINASHIAQRPVRIRLTSLSCRNMRAFRVAAHGQRASAVASRSSIARSAIGCMTWRSAKSFASG